MDDPDTYDHALTKIVLTKKTFVIRELFALTIVCMITKRADLTTIAGMYNRYRMFMFQDFIRYNRDSKEVAERKTLYYIQRYLQRCNLPTIPLLISLGLPELAIDENVDGDIFGKLPTTFKDFVRVVQKNENLGTA